MEDPKADVLIRCEYPDCPNDAEVQGKIAAWVWKSKGALDARIVMWARVVDDDRMFTCAGHAHVLNEGGVSLAAPLTEAVEYEQLILLS